MVSDPSPPESATESAAWITRSRVSRGRRPPFSLTASATDPP